MDFKNKVFSFKYKNHKFSVPHKQLIFRNFVLYPLKEILPKWRYPKNNSLIDTFVDKLSPKDKKSILKINKYWYGVLMLNQNELIKKVKNYNPFLNQVALSKAYKFALNAHVNQKRDSGDPYLIHPVA